MPRQHASQHPWLASLLLHSPRPCAAQSEVGRPALSHGSHLGWQHLIQQLPVLLPRAVRLLHTAVHCTHRRQAGFDLVEIGPQ